MRKELNLEERKQIQLEMLDEIDTFCQENDIKYSLAFGTLLGAIRHKGFIPWDDDVDIMMPLPDLLKFKKSFKSDRLAYLDVDVDKKYSFSFSRVAYKGTYNREGLICHSYGISIDLYVLIGIPENYSKFFSEVEPLFEKRIRMMKYRSMAIWHLPITNIPGFSKAQRRYRDYLFNMSVPYYDANMYYVIAGPLSLKEKMIYNKDLFRELHPVAFEDRHYMAISDWDYYLKLRYGDYMQLPPEDQRHPYHGGHFYWK